MAKPRGRKNFADLIRHQGGGQRTVQSLDDSRKIMDDLSSKLLEFSQPNEVVVQQTSEPSNKPALKSVGEQSIKSGQDQLPLNEEYGQTKGQTLYQIEPRTKGQLITPSTTPLITLTESQTNGLTEYHTRGQQSSDFELYPLTSNQVQILSFLVYKERKITAMREIEKNTGISYNTVRKVLKLFFSKGFITKEANKSVVGAFQGFTYTVNEPICKILLKQHRVQYHTEYHSRGHTSGRSDSRSDIASTDDDLISIKNHHLNSEELHDIYPKLYEYGFRSEHLGQVIKIWRVMKLDLDELHDSLEKAEWDVKENNTKMDKPLGYILSALKRGSYTAPKGFKLRREIQAEERLAKAKKLEAMLEEEISSLFKVWWGSLSREEQREVDAKIIQSGEKGIAFASREENKMPFRRSFFRNNVFDSRES